MESMWLRPLPRLNQRSFRTMSKYNVSPKRMRFYNSSAWRRCQRTKVMMARGICERCGKRGTEVHHKIPLTDENLDDPNISLSLDNLELLCTECHNRERKEKEGSNPNEIEFLPNGDVIVKSRRGG